MELKGSKTEENLRRAFSGESEATNKYTYYAEIAKRNGYEQIAEFFTYTANNEREHARLWFKLLDALPIDTSINLNNAALSENYEHSEMYPEFAKVAMEEGFEAIAKKFMQIAQIERYHEERFLALLDNVKLDEVFKKSDVVFWECRNCGHIEMGLEAPKVCVVCGFKQGYYQVKSENY